MSPALRALSEPVDPFSRTSRQDIEQRVAPTTTTPASGGVATGRTTSPGASLQSGVDPASRISRVEQERGRFDPVTSSPARAGRSWGELLGIDPNAPTALRAPTRSEKGRMAASELGDKLNQSVLAAGAGIVESLGIDNVMNRVDRAGIRNQTPIETLPTEHQDFLRRQRESRMAQATQEGWDKGVAQMTPDLSEGQREAAKFVGNVIGTIPTAALAAYTGGAGLVNLASKVGSVGRWLQTGTKAARLAASALSGAGTGLTVGTIEEIGRNLTDGDIEGFDALRSISNIAETTGDYTLYGILNPASRRLVDATPLGKLKGRVAGVAKDALAGALSGLGVGTMKVGAELVYDTATGNVGEVKEYLRGIAYESGQEFSEELVEAIALSIVQGLSKGRAGRFRITKGDVRKRIQQAAQTQVDEAESAKNGATLIPAPNVRPMINLLVSKGFEEVSPGSGVYARRDSQTGEVDKSQIYTLTEPDGKNQRAVYERFVKERQDLIQGMSASPLDVNMAHVAAAYGKRVSDVDTNGSVQIGGAVYMPGDKIAWTEDATRPPTDQEIADAEGNGKKPPRVVKESIQIGGEVVGVLPRTDNDHIVFVADADGYVTTRKASFLAKTIGGKPGVREVEDTKSPDEASRAGDQVAPTQQPAPPNPAAEGRTTQPVTEGSPAKQPTKLYRKGSASEFSEFTVDGRITGGRGTGHFGSGQYSFSSPGEGRIEVDGPTNPLKFAEPDTAKTFHRWSMNLLRAAEGSPLYAGDKDQALESKISQLALESTGTPWKATEEEIGKAIETWQKHRVVHPINILMGRKGYDGVVSEGKAAAEIGDSGDYGNVKWPRIDEEGRPVGIKRREGSIYWDVDDYKFDRDYAIGDKVLIQHQGRDVEGVVDFVYGVNEKSERARRERVGVRVKIGEDQTVNATPAYPQGLRKVNQDGSITDPETQKEKLKDAVWMPPVDLQEAGGFKIGDHVEFDWGGKTISGYISTISDSGPVSAGLVDHPEQIGSQTAKGHSVAIGRLRPATGKPQAQSEIYGEDEDGNTEVEFVFPPVSAKETRNPLTFSQAEEAAKKWAKGEKALKAFLDDKNGWRMLLTAPTSPVGRYWLATKMIEQDRVFPPKLADLLMELESIHKRPRNKDGEARLKELVGEIEDLVKRALSGDKTEIEKLVDKLVEPGQKPPEPPKVETAESPELAELRSQLQAARETYEAIKQEYFAGVQKVAEELVQRYNKSPDSNAALRKSFLDRIKKHGKIAPYRNKKLGEDFYSRVPIYLRSKSGVPLDQISTDMGFENEDQFLKELEHMTNLKPQTVEDFWGEAEEIVKGTEGGSGLAEALEVFMSTISAISEQIAGLEASQGERAAEVKAEGRGQNEQGGREQDRRGEEGRDPARERVGRSDADGDAGRDGRRAPEPQREAPKPEAQVEDDSKTLHKLWAELLKSGEGGKPLQAVEAFLSDRFDVYGIKDAVSLRRMFGDLPNRRLGMVPSAEQIRKGLDAARAVHNETKGEKVYVEGETDPDTFAEKHADAEDHISALIVGMSVRAKQDAGYADQSFGEYPRAAAFVESYYRRGLFDAAFAESEHKRVESGLRRANEEFDKAEQARRAEAEEEQITDKSKREIARQLRSTGFANNGTVTTKIVKHPSGNGWGVEATVTGAFGRMLVGGQFETIADAQKGALDILIGDGKIKSYPSHDAWNDEHPRRTKTGEGWYVSGALGTGGRSFPDSKQGESDSIEFLREQESIHDDYGERPSFVKEADRRREVEPSPQPKDQPEKPEAVIVKPGGLNWRDGIFIKEPMAHVAAITEEQAKRLKATGHDPIWRVRDGNRQWYAKALGVNDRQAIEAVLADEPDTKRPEVVNTRPDIKPPEVPNKVPADLADKLKDHQIEGVNLALAALEKQGAFLIADGTGAGKTSQALAIAEIAKRNGAKRILVLTENERIVDDAWLGDDKKVFGGKIGVKKWSPSETGSGIFATTYSQLNVKRPVPADGWDLVIFDESHNLKNWRTADKAEAGITLANNTKQVVFMSATPIDHPQDYRYMGAKLGLARVTKDHNGRVIDDGFYGFMDELGYRETSWEDKRTKQRVYKFVYKTGVSADDVVGRLDKIGRRLTEQGLMVKREVPMDGLEVNVVEVPVTQADQAVLEKIAAEFGGENASGPALAAMIMHQRRHLENMKAKEAIEIAKRELAEGRQVAIFVNFKEEAALVRDKRTAPRVVAESESVIKQIRDKLAGVIGRDKIAEVHGGLRDESAPDARAEIGAYQSGVKRVIIATTAAADTGVSLHDETGKAPRTQIVVTLPWSAKGMVQVAGRSHRLTSKSKTRLYVLSTDTVIDNRLTSILAAKMKNLSALVKGDVQKLDIDRGQRYANLEGGDAFAEEVERDDARREGRGNQTNRAEINVTEETITVAFPQSPGSEITRRLGRYGAGFMFRDGRWTATNTPQRLAVAMESVREYNKRVESDFFEQSRHDLEQNDPDRSGEGGFFGFFSWLFNNNQAPAQNFQSVDPEVTDRVYDNRGVKKQPILERLYEGWIDFKNRMAREWRHLPRTPEFAKLRFDLNRLKVGKGVAADKTVLGLRGVLRELTPEQYDLFTWKLLLDDANEEAEKQLNEQKRRPSDVVLKNGMTLDQVRQDLPRINQLVGAHPEITRALAARQTLVDQVVSEYKEAARRAIGFAPELDRAHYFRNSVQQARDASGPTGTRGMKAPTGASYLRKRDAKSDVDINTEYIEAEFEWMSNMIYHTKMFEIIGEVKRRFDISKRLRKEAASANTDAIDGIIADELASPNAPRDQNGNPVSQTDLVMKGFSRRLAIGFRKLEKLATAGRLWAGNSGEFQDVVDQLRNQQNPPNPDADARMFLYLQEVLDGGHPGAPEAARIFKALTQRRAFVKDMLGIRFKEWYDMVPETHQIWEPQPGNLIFPVWTVPEKLVDAALRQGLQEIEVELGELKQVMALGGRRPGFVIPNEVADTLNQIQKLGPMHEWGESVRSAIRKWKGWTLLNPFRWWKYNRNNALGDAEAVLAGNPSAFKKVPRATYELFQALKSKGTPSAELREWLELGGLQVNQAVVEDLGQLKGLEVFEDLYRNTKQPGWDKLVKTAWRVVRVPTDFREALLRYAAYLDYKEQMENDPDGKPKNWGASIREEVMALEDIKERAFKLSNDLLGAYDEVTDAGQFIRDFSPFWSFQELNTRRYWRMTVNAFRDGNGFQHVGHRVGIKLLKTAIRSPVIAYNVGKFYVKAHMLIGMIALWNSLLMGDDEEKDLPAHVREGLYVYWGKDENGKPRYTSLNGSLGELMAWFGEEENPKYVKALVSGEMSLKEILADMARTDPLKPTKGLANKILSQIGGPVKTAAEALYGVSIFPDAFDPRPIRDRAEYLLDGISVGHVYRASIDRPMRGNEGDSRFERWLRQAFRNQIYEDVEPGEAAYNDAVQLRTKHLEAKGLSRSVVDASDKSNALYHLKRAVRFNDREAANKYFREYIAEGGTLEGLDRSLDSLSPLAGIRKDQHKAFLDSLTPEEKETVKEAVAHADRWKKELIEVIKASPDLKKLPKK